MGERHSFTTIPEGTTVGAYVECRRVGVGVAAGLGAIMAMGHCVASTQHEAPSWRPIQSERRSDDTTPLPTAVPGGLALARECMASGRPQREINRCIVEALQSSASTETELRLLCVTYRSMGDRANGTSCMRRIRERLRRQHLEPSLGD